MSDFGSSDNQKDSGKHTEFRKKLELLINSISVDNKVNTPDFILAEYLTECLQAYDKAVKSRDAWFNHDVGRAVIRFMPNDA